MTIRYFWHLEDFLVLDRPDEDVPAGARPLSFTEFRDLVQCLARGGRLVTTAEGRPQVKGAAWPRDGRKPDEARTSGPSPGGVFQVQRPNTRYDKRTGAAIGRRRCQPKKRLQ